jgi:hypothetical protein
VLVRIDRRHGGELEPGTGDDVAQLELFRPGHEGSGPAAPELSPLAPVPSPPPFRIRRLSYSALALYERCSYRFYAERVVGLSPREGDAQSGSRMDGLAATEIGDAVHVALDHGDSASEAGERASKLYAGASEDDVERISDFVRAWHESAIAQRLAELDGVRSELPFAFEHEGVLLHGRFDLFRLHEGRALVVDYKTNRLEASAVELVDEDYAIQRLVYALAAFRAGADEVEVVYVFLERPEEPVTTTFGPGDVAALERRLSAAIHTIDEGNFAPSPGELVCAGCPVLDVVCAGPRLSGADSYPLDSAPASLGA